MKKANIVLDNQSTGLVIIERMDFERIKSIFDALDSAFHPEGLDGPNKELDGRCLALWHLTLASTGWTEDEFWEALDNMPHTCCDCGGIIDDEGNHLDDYLLLKDKTTPESKPN